MTKTARIPAFQLIRYYFKPYPWLVLAMVASSVAFVLLETVSLAIVYPTIDSLVTPGAGIDIPIARGIEKWIPGANTSEKTLWLISAFGITYILITLLNFVRTALSDILSRVVTRDFQLQLFKKYLGSDYQYLLDTQQGTIIFRVLTAPAYMTVMLSSLPKLIVAVLKMIFVGAVLLLFSFQLTMVMIGLGIVFYFGNRWLSDRVVYRFSSRSQQTSERQNVVANEAVTGIREVKIRDVESNWTERFLSEAAQICALNIRNDLFRSIPASALQIGFIGCVLAVMFIKSDTASVQLEQYVPLVGLYFYAFMRVAPSLNEIATLKMLVSERQPYAEAVYNELQTPSRRIEDGVHELERFTTGITFDHVSFTYPGRSYTLRDVSLTLERGKTTALVGSSGSGKSTLADLVVRLFDVDSGRILVDQTDLRQLTLGPWRRRIGYVSQDTFIINASVRDNIAFLSGGASAEDIEAAARAANAHKFILDLPQQYDTMLGDRGLKLSGGQRQRIAIARALVHRPDILIFDEATSALDMISELEVQAAINQIAEDHTVILIAHRLSTVRKADKIVVIEEGRVIEQGRHDELMAMRGAYSELYMSQEHTLV